MRRRIVLVGNAPFKRSVASLIDSADHVIRFNRASGYGSMTGTRVDELYLVNHGGQMAEWLMRDNFAQQRMVVAAGIIVLPIPILPGHLSACEAKRTGECNQDVINYREAAQARLRALGKTVFCVSKRDYTGAQSALKTGLSPQQAVYPSTGFVAIHQTLLNACADDRIELHGFTFRGWPGHPWDAERRWVQSQEDRGRLVWCQRDSYRMSC